MNKKNVTKTLSKPLLQLTEFRSSVFVIEFGQVNVPLKNDNVITIRYFNAQSQQ